MLKKEELHSLIRSLSKSEKRYFKLFCGREGGGDNYLSLFEFISKQTYYDETAIKIKFQGQKFIKQLHVTKNYLRKLILKSLRNYHAELSKAAELKDILRNVEILYYKELYENCQTELKRATSIADQYNLVLGSVEIENWNRKLEQTIRPRNYEAFQKVVDRQKAAVEIIQNQLDYWQLAITVSSNPFDAKQNALQKEPLLQDHQNALSLEAKSLHYNMLYLKGLQAQDSAAAEQALYTFLDLFKQYPHYLQEQPSLYASSVNNLLGFHAFKKQHEKAILLIQKAKEVYESWKITASNRSLLKQLLCTYNIELEIYRDAKEFAKQASFIKRTEAFIETNVQKVPKEYLHSFWFQFASIHFTQEHYSISLKWINLLLNSRDKNIRIDLRIQAHMLNLMVHLEQQNLMVLRYYVDSAKRYLKKVKEVQPFEQLLLRFFMKIGKAPLLEYESLFLALQQQLFPENQEALVPKDVLNFIDYREWIERKLR